MFVKTKRANLLSIRLMAVLMLLLMLSMLLVKPVHAADTAIGLVSDEIRLGQRIVFSGNGFGSGENLAVWLTSPTNEVVDCGSIPVNDKGSFIEVPSPCYLKKGLPGTWTITAKGLKSNLSATLPFTLLESDVSANINNENGVSNVSISGSNWFSDPDTGFGEKVDVWFTIDGKVVPVGTIAADPDGNISTDGIITPPLEIGKIYKLTAHGSTSDRTVVADVEVTDPNAAPPADPGEGEE